MPDVLMPRLSDTMEEGVLSQWVARVGDQVRKGDVLAVIETDKAAMDMEAYDEGVLTHILVREGASVPIGAPIAVIGEATTAAPAPLPVSAPDQAERAVVPPPAAAPLPVPSPAGRLPASPLARKLAREHGIDLAAVSGSGPGGRIVRADIEHAARHRGGAPPVLSAGAPAGPVPPAPVGPPAPPPASPSPFAAAAPQPAPAAAAPPTSPSPFTALAMDAEEIPLTTVRRLTAQRLAASAREAPHFCLTVVAVADQLLAFRAEANGRRGADIKITVTDLLIRACATALAAHPEVNASWDETRILRHRHVNIGVAVAVDDGLIVPVIRDAGRKTLTEIAHEAHDLTTRARTRKLTPDELAGGTFTISNLGMYGIRQFTAVINPPQAAILAVGEAVRQPIVRDDQVTIATTMTLTLCIDHRAVDGATAARFLTHLRELIKQPLDIVL
jgi:pyruvate dehydrogenase E2 component (dihydrolipoyllysine-residue acetyltransferase)